MAMYQLPAVISAMGGPRRPDLVVTATTQAWVIRGCYTPCQLLTPHIPLRRTPWSRGVSSSGAILQHCLKKYSCFCLQQPGKKTGYFGSNGCAHMSAADLDPHRSAKLDWQTGTDQGHGGCLGRRTSTRSLPILPPRLPQCAFGRAASAGAGGDMAGCHGVLISSVKPGPLKTHVAETHVAETHVAAASPLGNSPSRYWRRPKPKPVTNAEKLFFPLAIPQFGIRRLWPASSHSLGARVRGQLPTQPDD
ncbi:hypothetical protein G6O67_007733 [Ophiocordyceps sinensis]|uniref:Uncharacterized protein n=1 Tax=Ophiocordyceps sinensis TaxID=72228 RepID=A0A8H4LVT0_9HYPO|nr:hypothetical protein G6O67_007733 [Ophiocordyceps sinensis]